MSTSLGRTSPTLNLWDGVFLVFLAGKLYGFLDWSWWAVFSPLIVWAVLIFIIAFCREFAKSARG